MIEIRKETLSDREDIRQVVRSAFDSDIQANLVELLREQAEPYLSLVATLNNRVVGHIAFSAVTFQRKSMPLCAQLSPVSVVPALQGQGIGAELVRAGLTGCLDQGWVAVFLVGNPAYYSRFGFQLAAPIGLHCTGEHDPYLQYLELLPDSLAGISGLVSFHPAFMQLDS